MVFMRMLAKRRPLKYLPGAAALLLCLYQLAVGALSLSIGIDGVFSNPRK